MAKYAGCKEKKSKCPKCGKNEAINYLNEDRSTIKIKCSSCDFDTGWIKFKELVKRGQVKV